MNKLRHPISRDDPKHRLQSLQVFFKSFMSQLLFLYFLKSYILFRIVFVRLTKKAQITLSTQLLSRKYLVTTSSDIFYQNEHFKIHYYFYNPYLIIPNKIIKMNADDEDNTEKMIAEIRQSKLSGRFFFQRWVPYGRRRPWRKAFRNLTEREMLTLLEKIAKLSLTCQSPQQYRQIAGCYQFLEKGRLMDKIIQDLQNRNILITQEMTYNYCLLVQEKARKRVKELGLQKPFQEILQLNKNKKNADIPQEEQFLSQNLEQKTSKPRRSRSKSPQNFFAKLKAMFTRQKSGVKQPIPEPTMEYIQLDNNEKEQS